MKEDIREMEITDYNIIHNISAAFYRLWKLKLVVLFATVIGFLAALIYVTFVGTDFTFYSNASIYSAVYGSYSETVSGVSLMNTYSGILGSSRVCDRAAATINDSDITSEYLQSLVNSGRVSLSGASSDSKKYGYRLDLVTRLTTPNNVVEITNAMADAFAGEINELLGQDVLQVFDKATHSFRSTGMSQKIMLLIFAGVAFVLSAVIIFFIEFFSSKVYLVSQCCNDRDSILGILPLYADKEKS